MRISDWSSDVCSSDLHITKNGKARDVPFTDRVLSILDELNERSENARWFPWAIGSSGPLYLLQNIRADMKGMGFQFDDVVLHTMRHTCASRLDRKSTRLNSSH